MILLLLMQTSNMSFRMQADIAYGGFTRHQLTLPLSKDWFLARYIIRFALQSLFITLPTLCFTLFLLASKIENLSIRPVVFTVSFPLILITMSSMLIAFGLLYDFAWLRANLWRRRLDPLLMLSTVFCPWQAVYQWSPYIGYVLLLNPITHVVELLRSSLLYTPLAVPSLVHISALLLTISGNCYLMRIGLNKRLDPV
jgi:hypothetical protein